jgi:concanavalin A-like lectin/glucanase superfamily protein
MNRRLAATLSGIVLAAALLLASGASGATLAGDYQFQGTRASSGPGAAVSDVGGTNSFTSDTVLGSTRQVLAFPLHSGVQMTPSVGSGSVPYSIVATFRLDNIGILGNAYRRILDPSNGTEDTGFYVLQGKADYFADSIDDVISSSVVFGANVYATVAVTSSPPSPSKIYVNGIEVVNANETLPVVANTLRFFKDDSNVEESAGAVSCLRVFNGVLSAGEVGAVGASPTCSAPPAAPSNQTPTTPTPAPPTKKKCKKKHKKRSAEASKKCKKHKKHKKH